MNYIKEIDDLKDCIDSCCRDLPIVHYNKPLFRIICRNCLNEVLHEKPHKAMIAWNLMVRKQNHKVV